MTIDSSSPQHIHESLKSLRSSIYFALEEANGNWQIERANGQPQNKSKTDLAARHIRPPSATWPRSLSHTFDWRKLDRMDNWIVADPEHLGGSPRVRGTRISVALILESLSAGMTLAQIVDAYPSLTEESVRGVLAELAHRKYLQTA